LRSLAAAFEQVRSLNWHWRFINKFGSGAAARYSTKETTLKMIAELHLSLNILKAAAIYEELLGLAKANQNQATR